MFVCYAAVGQIEGCEKQRIESIADGMVERGSGMAACSS